MGVVFVSFEGDAVLGNGRGAVEVLLRELERRVRA